MMYHRLRFLTFAAALLATLSGCDATSNTVESEFVVQSYLIAEEPLPPVRVFRPTAVDQEYDPGATAVHGAEVVIRRLEGDGQVRSTYGYEERSPGVYRSQVAGIPVRAGTTYHLEVRPPADGAPIQATTTVPEGFDVVEVENREAMYRGEAQPSITITRSEASERQTVYVFTVTSLLDFENRPEEELQAEMTPFFADAFDPDEDDIKDERVNSSPLFNEANYEVTDGTLTIALPWIAVSFYGPNRLTINALDDNLYDLLRTQQVQQGGLSPGEIPNVIEHVEGGAGIFGSYARQTVEVEVLRP